MNKKTKAVIIAICICAAAFGIRLLLLPHIVRTSYVVKDKFMEKFEGDSGLLVFPDQVREEDVSDYYYSRHYIVFDPDIQLYLRCQYSEEDFRKECERLAAISVEHEGTVNDINYNVDDYILPAYEAMNAFDYCYEYALVDEASRTIDYVFLQQINDVEDITFSKDKLPDGYGTDRGLDGFCIYALSFEGDAMDVDGRLTVYE